MKSVMQAAWLLTVSFGNLIVVIIAEAKFFERQVGTNFLVFLNLFHIIIIIFFPDGGMFLLAKYGIVFLQSMEFFLFAALMYVDMVVFAALAVRYKYVDEIEAEKNAEEIVEEKGKINEGFSKDETKF